MKIQLFAILAACVLQAATASSAGRKASTFLPTDADKDTIRAFKTVEAMKSVHGLKKERVRNERLELPKNQKKIDALIETNLLPRLAQKSGNPEKYLLSKIQREVSKTVPVEHKKMWEAFFKKFDNNLTGKIEPHFTKSLKGSKTEAKLVAKATSRLLAAEKEAIAFILVMASGAEYSAKHANKLDVEELGQFLVSKDSESKAFRKRIERRLPTWANASSGSWDLTKLKDAAYAYLQKKFGLLVTSRRGFNNVEFLINNASAILPTLDAEADPVTFLANLLKTSLTGARDEAVFKNIIDRASVGTLTQAYVDAYNASDDPAKLSEPRLTKYAITALTATQFKALVTGIYPATVDAYVKAQRPGTSKKAKAARNTLRTKLMAKNFKDDAIAEACEQAPETAEGAITSWGKKSSSASRAITKFMNAMRTALESEFAKA